MPETGESRTRTHPRIRFSPDAAEFDLRLETEALLAEPEFAHQRHRQVALFRHGPMTVALYHFEPGANLPNHVVDGPIIIHVLEGEVAIKTATAGYELSGGCLLRLAPGVEHNISAKDECRLLLTFCVEGPASHRA